ncbi:hypothetical protein V2J09_022226 [Rumex salicifolius]
MWVFSRKGTSGFSSSSTAEEVTQGIDASGLTAIVTVRNMDAGGEVREKIMREIPSAKVEAMELDLSSMASVKKFASDYESARLPLNLLINNAGVSATPFTLSKDGIELQFATNHLGHFLLTHLLLNNMKRTAQETGREGRIVNVSSEAHRISYREGIRFDRLNDQSGYNRLYAYGQSKLANILHARELDRRLKEDGVNVTANSVLVAHTLGKFVLKSIPQGAATTCYVALNPEVKGVSGAYFNHCNLAKPTPMSQDVELARKLWDFSINHINPK